MREGERGESDRDEGISGLSGVPLDIFLFLCDKEEWNYCSDGAPRPQRQFAGGPLGALCVICTNHDH